MTPLKAAPRLQQNDRLQRFQNLMSRRVRNLLLVASAYDAFILEEDGQIEELLMNEFMGVTLRRVPGMTRIPSGKEALALLSDGGADLVITTGNLGDMRLSEFIRQVKETSPDVPVVLLAFDTRQLTDLLSPEDRQALDGIFVWQGDFRILLAIVKYFEDRWNVARDTATLGVSVIILIEDSIRYYSSFLPMLYTELLKQSQRVISEGMNLTHKMMRMQARPKILLCTTYEEAWAFYERYSHHVIGLISDVEFPRGGESDPEAGIRFTRAVREKDPDLPIMVQSHDPDSAALARDAHADWVLKGSPVLLHELSRFMLTNFGFGDFIFRLDDGTEVGRARDLRSLEETVMQVPDPCILQHARRNHFSTWLKARTEFGLAEALRQVKATDFDNAQEIRRYLADSIRHFRLERLSGIIAGFEAEQFDDEISFAKIGSGSMGGKARGLAFLRQSIYNYRLRSHIEGVEILVPPTVVLATDLFDQFLEDNHLRDFGLEESDDAHIERRFVEARFPKRGLNRLRKFLEKVDYPLVVRSSSLLEDSQHLPFAGVYSTFMVPNVDPDPRVRLRQLLTAIKRIYASTYFRRTKSYIKPTPYRLEEEKMAVIVQKLVGARRGSLFYPEFSGVAQSYNFYPNPPVKPEDGLVSVVMGLGKMVTDGERAIRFSPRYPRHLPQFAAPRDVLRQTQTEFYALDFEHRSESAESEGLRRFGVETALEHGALDSVASIYSHENQAIYDGLSRPGSPVITFAPILKHDRFPLCEVVELLLDVGSRGLNSPVEMEFAVNLSTPRGRPSEFACLQMRPLVLSHAVEETGLLDTEPANTLCWSNRVLGNGVVDGIRDLVVVDREHFNRARSVDAAAEVARLNARLTRGKTPYILVGVGRWGASDPWLGIPVTWDQISGARVIVEAGFREFRVTASQGSHFFHNLTSASVGYFTVGYEDPGAFVDWDWLSAQPAAEQLEFVRHIRLEQPMSVRMLGHEGRGIIIKPPSHP